MMLSDPLNNRLELRLLQQFPLSSLSLFVPSSISSVVLFNLVLILVQIQKHFLALPEKCTSTNTNNAESLLVSAALPELAWNSDVLWKCWTSVVDPGLSRILNLMTSSIPCNLNFLWFYIFNTSSNRPGKLQTGLGCVALPSWIRKF